MIKFKESEKMNSETSHLYFFYDQICNTRVHVYVFHSVSPVSVPNRNSVKCLVEHPCQFPLHTVY